MMHGLTVIQGGRSEPAAQSVARTRSAGLAGWEVDLRRVGTVDDGSVAAWRALMTRRAVTDTRVDRALMPIAARTQAGGRTIAFALAWDRDGNGGESLQGVAPPAIPHPIRGRARVRARQPSDLPHPAAALIDGARAAAIETAIRGRLAGLRRPLRLDAPTRLSVRQPATRPVLAASRADGRVRTIPADCIVGVRPEGYEAPRAIEHVTDPARSMAASEASPVPDARHAARPTTAEPSETSMLRVVTRLFACRAGEFVAGALHLGASALAVVRRHGAEAKPR